MFDPLYDCDGFDWDEGNREKNWYLHEVTDGECEEFFLNVPIFVYQDTDHSQGEKRYYALGQTHNRRWLFVAFTIRNQRIRVISARDMADREAKLYADRTKHYSRFRE